MMTLEEKQTEFVELFDSLGTWQDKFNYLIELGNELPEMHKLLRVPATKINSCQSQTYFYASAPAGAVSIQGWSNSAIVSGLIAVIREIFDGCSIEELHATEMNFHIEAELINNLTEARKAGLMEMINSLGRL